MLWNRSADFVALIKSTSFPIGEGGSKGSMTLHQLVIFATVAKHLNISRASTELHVSQACLSQLLKGLQEEYKAKFYLKNSKGIELTERGQLFFTYTKLILKQIGRLNTHFDSSPRAIKQTPLLVGGSHGLAEIFLPSVLATFKKLHPEVKIILRASPIQTIERKILNSKVEVALMRHPAKSPHIISEPYRQEWVIPFVSTDHPLARIRKLTLFDLEGVPLIIRGANTSSTRAEERLRQLETQGLTLNIAMLCETPSALKTAVRSKLGVGFLSWELVKSDVRNGVFKTIKIPNLNFRSTTFILYHRDRPLSDNARDFLTLLHKQRRKRPSSRISVSISPSE